MTTEATALAAGSRPLDRREAEQLAFELGGEVAFLSADQGVFFARREAWPPLSPVLRLLRGVYELEPKRARWIARRRIFSTLPASSTCLGATRVAARQLTAGVQPRDHGLRSVSALPRTDAGAAAPLPLPAPVELEPALAAIVANADAPSDRALMALARRLADERAAGTASAAREGARVDKPVAALLVDAEGAILGWATNTGARNATSHAELNLVLGWLGRAERLLPPGCRVYATLKPCKLCAGLIWDSAERPHELRVFYADEDPLRYARETVLDGRSMARRRVARDEADLTRVLQQRIPLT